MTRMKNKTVLYGIAIFLFFIAILQLTLLLENHRFKFDHFLIVILLIILLLFRNKVSWSFLLIFCLYGVYNMIFRQQIYSDPTYMNFTGSLYNKIRSFFEYYQNNYVWTFLWDFPRYFYILMVSLIVANPIRNLYWSKTSRAK
jgi:hypothetical protein